MYRSVATGRVGMLRAIEYMYLPNGIQAWYYEYRNFQ